jgi:hypothetical protein
MNRIIAAAALAAAVWGLARWLDRRYARLRKEPHNPTERWENEGGALTSPEWTQSSQAQRQGR